jgi:hypothetical protein
MVVNKATMDTVCEALECAVRYAEAGKVPTGQTYTDLLRAMLTVQVKTGRTGKA